MTEFQERPSDAAGENQAAERLSAFGLLAALPGRLTSRYGLAALGLAALGVLIYLAASADGFVRSSELERELLKLQEEIAELQDENRLLGQKLDRLQTDPSYVEDEARKKLGLVRPGEIIYRLAEEPDLSDEPGGEPPVSP
ncbi:MAG: septum formation initiator family protein [Candidatus Adiutrix sp.]|jgi:cell division protein FtsB|nr:septum formation initiator family protein [Candidatus Adiutrix sp.]